MITEPQTRPAALARRTNPAYALLAAVQFLTRIPTPQIPYTDRTLSDALAYFPLIGLLIGTLAALVNQFLAPHLSRPLSALCTVTFTVLITGALHEDGLADCADAFFGHHSRERTLAILRDSRIGTYGAAALALSLGARVLLVAALPLNHVFPYLIAAHTLARWSPLPLSYLPPPAPKTAREPG
ncbi:cobalamin-5-phosphate synthase CobS [Granulicella tundricola MP5ACTX9]|uniref:Adenosylcobinamide-GDP ribazoletransferase n=1 Tax=Granulicella tundricola (strain ATCC BAA-1859 / DSM 23138 / MP5ACTX9) TaxID=1198114 RepID=E8X1C9_GRATM|nr:cobalamin-5-phosphate synthase CobS [Granulicella tundricola MP5ACTX9]